MVIPSISRVEEIRNEVEKKKKEYQLICNIMANEIDELIGKNEVPDYAQEFAEIILRHICSLRCDDATTKAAVMVLMISAKSACQLGWFPQRETQELLDNIHLMWKGFNSAENVTPSVDNPLSLFQQVIERFYPFVKPAHIIVSFEAKQESKALVKDFYISKNMPHSLKSKVELFVVRSEDISKSSCIMHPQGVSFLVNGRSVEKRVNISMDSGPQPPTNVTGLVYPGANLLQAIGCFGGSYLIVIAFVDVLPLPDKPVLKDYVHSEVSESNSDRDVIEGQSRISLGCPISRTRIKLPVKGHVCKHLQCFDFWNYAAINKRRPSWRCPHCNQSVCYTDIRVDQNMIKILEEVGGNAADVVISADGSWTVVTVNNENVDLLPQTTHDPGDPISVLTSGPTVMDLTGDEDEMDTSCGTHVDEQKPCLSEIRGLSDNTHKTATDYTMLHQSSAPINALPQLPQTLNAFSGQQFMNTPQIVNTRDSAARQTIPMPFLPISSPQDRLATNTASFHTSMPAAQTSQFQGSHVASLGHCLGRTSDLMERWNNIRGNVINQTQIPTMPPLHHRYAMQNQRTPIRSISPAQQRHMLSSVTHPQTSAVDYGRATDQRPMQTLNPGGAMEQFSSREFMNLASANTANWQPHNRMANTANWQPQTRMANTANWQQQTRLANTASWQPLTQVANTADWQPQAQMANTADWQPQAQMANTADWQPQTRMRGSITPGSTAYDQMIILPTRPVHAQSQTLPLPQTFRPPQTTTYDSMADEIQAFLGHPSYPISNSETQPVIGSLPVAEGFGTSGSFWSMPPEAW
ncbi:hypothetical protein AALP_AA1G092800 [Arabis alpina]|uniref:SP-RING-type domain-containing protein n=1 Tax=Arabis alpina TaxID=50452 RepID=A0A087HM44_ARAAL|nr:hypothetical protein AALP_AA1G092800 [Arabis alpina]